MAGTKAGTNLNSSFKFALAVVPSLLSNWFYLHFKWRLVREFLQQTRQQTSQAVFFDVVWFFCIQMFVTRELELETNHGYESEA